MPTIIRVDARTKLIIAILIMLLNGGVLGLIHRGLSADVLHNAADWPIGCRLQHFAGSTAYLWGMSAVNDRQRPSAASH